MHTYLIEEHTWMPGSTTEAAYVEEMGRQGWILATVAVQAGTIVYYWYK